MIRSDQVGAHRCLQQIQHGHRTPFRHAMLRRVVRHLPMASPPDETREVNQFCDGDGLRLLNRGAQSGYECGEVAEWDLASR